MSGDNIGRPLWHGVDTEGEDRTLIGGYYTTADRNTYTRRTEDEPRNLRTWLRHLGQRIRLRWHGIPTVPFAPEVPTAETTDESGHVFNFEDYDGLSDEAMDELQAMAEEMAPPTLDKDVADGLLDGGEILEGAEFPVFGR